LDPKSNTYICYTLTIEKTQEFELVHFFDTVFTHSNYQLMSDTGAEDMNAGYGAMYDTALTHFANCKLIFYVQPNEKAETDKKLQAVPKGTLVEMSEIEFCEQEIITEYQKSFMLTPTCEIIFAAIALRDDTQYLQIIMPPKNAFGTGSHMSTKLAAQLIEKYVKSGNQLIDVGTGTGILAIYAAKKGAAAVLAVDSDPLSIAEAEMNKIKNGVDKLVQVKQNHFLNGMNLEAYDVIVANLSLNLSEAFFATCIDDISAHQSFVCSGIMDHEQLSFERLLTANNLRVEDKIIESGWVAYYVQRNK